MKKLTTFLVLFIFGIINAQYLSEDFESGTMPPSGWTLNTTNASETWTIYNSGHSGDYSASCLYDANLQQQDEVLLSPVIDLSSATDPVLLFYFSMSYYWGVDPNNNYDLKVQATTDGGNTYTDLWVEDNFGTFNNYVWTPVSIDLTNYVGVNNLQLAFRYVGVDGAQAIIDDIIVSERPAAPNCAENLMPADGSVDVSLNQGRMLTFSWDAPSSGQTPTGYIFKIGTAPGTYIFETSVSDTTFNLSGFQDDTTYYWTVIPAYYDTEATGCQELSFTTAHMAPAHDICSGAMMLNVDADACATPTVVDNSFATDSGEAAPSCADYAGGDLWFSVTVPASGSVTVETTSIANSNLSDTGMSIYSGSCGSLTEIQCDDDSSDDGYFSKIELTGQTPGDVLYVRVWEYGNDTFGEFNICAWDPEASAVADNQIEGFKFYPNPVNHTLNISAKNNIDMLSITNIAGQEVIRLTPNTTATQVDMSRLPNGMYFVKANVNGEITAFKVTKK